MCGICGFYSNKEGHLDNLIDMNKTISHRGPDDHGEEIYEIRHSFRVGFAHCRLSIMDLSPMGHQPMHSKDKRISVVFNGEIYNFRDLKKELGSYPFQSNCDTEVIIAAYLKWGISCVDKFNGMFAIAILDRKDDSLYLVRDRIGKKPLYYYVNNETLFFASELKPIMKADGFVGEIETDIIGNYLHHLCIPAPYTIFRSVYKLLPGSILKFHYGKLETWKYWDVSQKYHEMQNKPVNSFEMAKEELKDKLKDSVRARMAADVAVGAFLSGGYDSSMICAIAQEISEVPIRTYCIGFEEEELNEAIYAKKIADHLGTRHTELYISDAEMYKLVEEIPHYYDEPFGDSSQISTMLVSRLAKDDVSVVLTGDGGDEFFCGYNMYTKLQKAQKIDWQGAIIYYLRKFSFVRKNYFNDRSLIQRMVSDSRDRNIKTQIGVNTYIDTVKSMLLKEGVSYYYPIEQKYHVKEWDVRRMLLDMDTYLPDDILCKVDRASMRYALECRCPILDKDVMEYSYRLPQYMKNDNGNQKRILKSIAYDYIPRELLDRPKRGFGVPVNIWLRKQLRKQLEEYIDFDFLKNQGIFHVDNTQKIVLDYLQNGDKGLDSGANYSKIVWPYFMFQQWYSCYMK